MSFLACLPEMGSLVVSFRDFQPVTQFPAEQGPYTFEEQRTRIPKHETHIDPILALGRSAVR